MLFLPVVGFIITLTLWGSLAPVQMGLHPVDSFLKRITGSVQTSFLLAGPYQLFTVPPKINDPSDEGVDGYTEPYNLMDLMVPPTVFDNEFVDVPDISAADPMPDPSETASSSQPTSTAMDFDFVDSPPAPYVGRYSVLVVAAVVYLGYWLALVIFENLTPSDAVKTLTCLVRSTPKLMQPIEGSVTVTIDSRAMVSVTANQTICDLVLASLEQECWTSEFQVPIRRDLVPYVDIAARFSQAPDRRPVTSSQWMVGAGVLSFHSIVDNAIYRLVVKVCMVSTASPLAGDPDTASRYSRSNSLEALVLRRLENVSSLAFLGIVGSLLARWDDLQTFQVNEVVSPANVGSLVTGKKRRMGAKQRRRIGKSKLVRQQNEIISVLAPPAP